MQVRLLPSLADNIMKYIKLIGYVLAGFFIGPILMYELWKENHWEK